MSYRYRPSKEMTNEEMKEAIKLMDAEVKADREARGLPPESPPKFVPVAMGWYLYERCEPLHKFAIRYAQLCDRSDEILKLTDEQVEWVQSFRPYVQLINEVKDSSFLRGLGMCTDGLILEIEKRNKYESVIELLSLMTIYLDFLKGEYYPPNLEQCVWRHDLDNKENETYRAEIYEEYERLKDSEYFEQEYDRLRQHYESVKHLY